MCCVAFSRSRHRDDPVSSSPAHAKRKTSLRLLASGVNSYIVKPVEFDKFTDVVTQLGTTGLLFNQRPMVLQPALT